MQILFCFLETMLHTTTCLFCEGISCISSSASSLSSLPPAHPLALVDWVVFSNVSTFTEFPPPLENKVLLANLVIICAMFHPVFKADCGIWLESIFHRIFFVVHSGAVPDIVKCDLMTGWVFRVVAETTTANY
jgi:hypothetical protein